ncbi:MAG: hypothetical protein IIC78_12665 [Chloroflexi bacterium]|nr:hypothetical protein [Chloroflexota bacterium]
MNRRTFFIVSEIVGLVFVAALGLYLGSTLIHQYPSDLDNLSGIDRKALEADFMTLVPGEAD